MSNLRQLKVTFDSFDDLVEKIGPGLSRTHLFAPTDEVIAEGTRIRLEIGTVRKGALIRGVTKVASPAEDVSRLSPSGAAPAPGLHLHLIHLDPSSTRLVDSIVRGEIIDVSAGEKSGPSPFDIPSAEPEPEPSEPSEPEPPEPEPSEPEPPSEDGRPEPAEILAPVAEAPNTTAPGAAGRLSRGQRFAWPLALAALAAVFLLMFKLATGRDGDQLLTGRDRQTEIAEPAQALSMPPPAETAAETATSEEPSVDREPPAVDPGETEAPDPERRPPPATAEQVEDAVRAWADALSRQDPAAYIELYAADYHPAGLDRDTWKRRRRARILAPAQLDVSVSELEIQGADPERAIARFHQLYATEDKALTARKVLELERFETGWKIVAERLEE